MNMGLYVRVQPAIRAFQWNGSHADAAEIAQFLGEAVASYCGLDHATRHIGAHISLKTSEGLKNARLNDWFVEESPGGSWKVVGPGEFSSEYVEALPDSDRME